VEDGDVPRAKRPSRAVQPAPKPALPAVCEHQRAQTVAFLGRSVFEEVDVSLMWCGACGALGSARYADGESIRWQTPRTPASPP